MSSERIAAWLEAQDNPSSPESDKIDHNEGFIEGYVVPRMTRDETEALDLASASIVKNILPERLFLFTAKGKQPAIVASNDQTNVRASVQQKIIQQTNDREFQTAALPLIARSSTKRPSPGELSSNSTRLSQTKARFPQPERRRSPYKKGIMEAEQSNIKMMGTTSKRNVSYDKRKEIPPTSSEPTTISPPAPEFTPPSAKRRKTTCEGKEKEVVAEPLSSQESVHSPWRSIWRVHLPPRREW